MGNLNLGAGSLTADTWENSDGTENYKCRAWVNFNGTGTVSIRGSGNVSSITDNGVGRYTVNFLTAMEDLNFITLVNGSGEGISNVSYRGTIDVDGDNSSTNSTKLVYIQGDGGSSSATADHSTVRVAVFR